MRLINADAILPRLRILSIGERQIYGEASWGFVRKCIAVVEDAPTEEPEAKTAHWVRKERGRYYVYECDHCGNTYSTYSKYSLPRFCCDCGCKLEVKE